MYWQCKKEKKMYFCHIICAFDLAFHKTINTKKNHKQLILKTIILYK